MKVWGIDCAAFSKATEFAGCQAIRSHVPEISAGEALSIYCSRQIIEQGFEQLKNEVGGSCFETTESSYRGKLFVYTLAQSIRMSMLYTAHKKMAQNSNLFMPGNSLRKLLFSAAQRAGQKALFDKHFRSRRRYEAVSGQSLAGRHRKTPEDSMP